jgi:hypothetical protein
LEFIVFRHFVKTMKIFFFILFLACFAIVISDASAVKKSSSGGSAKKQSGRATSVPKQQVKSQSVKSQAAVFNLVQDRCTQYKECGLCFDQNGTCYWDTAAAQCRSVSLVLANNYCPPSSASTIVMSSIVIVATFVAMFVF